MSNEDFDNFLEFKKKYNELVLLIYKESGEQKLKVYIDNVTDEDLLLLINNFCKNIENNKKIKKLFLNRNERIFSQTNNIKIIPSFNLKSFLIKCNNNSYIWECIQLLYAIYRSGDIKNKEFVNKIVKKIESCNYSGGNSIEQIDITDDNISEKKVGKIDDMIMDIADTLRNNLVSDSKNNVKVNPFENMLKTSQMISQKYSNDLKKGKISMNDMFDSLGRMMGEIDKKTSNDEELKNIDVSEMPKPEDLMKDLGFGNDIAGTNPMDMISSLLGGKSQKKEKLTPGQMKEMEEFYSKMTTADINTSEENVDQLTKSEEKSNNIINSSLGALEILDNTENMNSRLDNINKKLISQLPKDKQKMIESLTGNMQKIMEKI